MKTIALRLYPQQDLLLELNQFAQQHQLEAACVLTCVGSLRQVALRLANQNETTYYKGKFEIVALTGTLSYHGAHYHMAISDSTGHTQGGHVMEGCLIYTTAEIVLAVLPDITFARTYDPNTGYEELEIITNKS